MIAEQHVFHKIRSVCLLVALICAGVYFFLVVSDSFVGLPHFSARYLLLPWLLSLSHFNMALFIVLFSVQIIVVISLFVAFSLFTGAMVITPGKWNIVNFWHVIVLFAPPNLCAVLIYIGTGLSGLEDASTGQNACERIGVARGAVAIVVFAERDIATFYQ